MVLYTTEQNIVHQFKNWENIANFTQKMMVYRIQFCNEKAVIKQETITSGEKRIGKEKPIC